MKLNKFALAISLMLPIAGVYAQQANLPKCKVAKDGSAWKVAGFKGHKSAGAMTYTSSNTGFAEVNPSTGELTAVAAGNRGSGSNGTVNRLKLIKTRLTTQSSR